MFFSIMQRIIKGSDLPKKMGVTEHPTKIFADQVTAKVVSSIRFKQSSFPKARYDHFRMKRMPDMICDLDHATPHWILVY